MPKLRSALARIRVLLTCGWYGHDREIVSMEHEMEDYPFWSETYVCRRCGETWTNY